MSDAMIFGAFLPQGWKMELSSIDGAEAKWAKAVEIAVLAEELGYDSIWVYDHFHNVPRPAHEAVFECWTTLAAISQRTSRIRLGQMVGCNSYRQPSVLAKITSTIDVISGGRLDWGIGAGWYENEYKGYGFEFPVPKVRIGMLRECVEIVKSMWTEPETSYDGQLLHDVTRALRPQAGAAAASPDLDRWWRPEAHAAGRRASCRSLELRREARRVRGQVRAAQGTLQGRRARLRRDPQDLVAGGVRPRDRSRGEGGGIALVLGRAGRVVDGGQPRRDTRPGRRDASTPTATSAARASCPGAPTIPTPRRSRFSPRR